jgi:hypothetical protein
MFKKIGLYFKLACITAFMIAVFLYSVYFFYLQEFVLCVLSLYFIFLGFGSVGFLVDSKNIKIKKFFNFLVVYFLPFVQVVVMSSICIFYLINKDYILCAVYFVIVAVGSLSLFSSFRYYHKMKLLRKYVEMMENYLTVKKNENSVLFTIQSPSAYLMDRVQRQLKNDRKDTKKKSSNDS